MRCRHCGAATTLPVLDLGSAPPSNAYLTSEDLNRGEVWLPLRLLACESCWLVQTEDFAAPDDLFSPTYAYFSSTSTSWVAHARRFAREAIERFGLGPGSLVGEIAANDGYLLRPFQEAGIPCFGVEPTTSTAAAARALGLDIVEAFFGTELARLLIAKGRRADLLVANNVLAHVPDIDDFVRGFALLLQPGGVATFEFPHLLQMITQGQFDTAYHEHYSYLSLTAVQSICAKNGLAIFDVTELPTHGGSLRIYAQLLATGRHRIEPGVSDLLHRERQAGIDTREFYAGFQKTAEETKRRLLQLLLDAKKKKLRVAGYGAAAKGNTMLNFAGVRPDLLSYVVDRAPSKQGRFLPGSRIPIVDPEFMQIDKPDLILIIPWNLRDEIIGQLGSARSWQARHATVMPKLMVERF